MADAALDYQFLRSANVVRLVGRLARGWKEGPYGPYFLGVCTFDWRLGVRCRAEVRLFPQSNSCTFDALSESEWKYEDQRDQVVWCLSDGAISVDLALIRKDGSFTHLIEDTGLGRGRILHSVYSNGRTAPCRAELKLLVTLDKGRGALTHREWGGLPSAGLPTLGRRR